MKTNHHILMVDDDQMFSALTQEYLQSRGLNVKLYHSASDALNAFRENEFDLCILDVKMPIKDGFTLAEEIRNNHPLLPIIFLTGQAEKESRVRGFNIGADDYVTKPFSMEELSLRIQAILRRVKVQESQKVEFKVFEVGKFQFNSQTRELSHITRQIKLSAIETRLLQLFCESNNGMIERETALRQIWDDEDMLRGRSLNVYVSKLRQYLQADGNIEILNVHGVGYQLVIR
ncbi:MAG: response regulator transcription factor [Lewinellaceae bacterium]|nr:response regulator transcription factor [Lewinellaceae bacterium]